MLSLSSLKILWIAFKGKLEGQGNKEALELKRFFKRGFKEKLNKEKFFYEKSIYLENGINLTEALEISENEEDLILMQKLLEGEKLSDAMRFMKIFNNRELSLVRLAEETGNMGETFKSLYESIKEEKELNSKIRTVLIYPMVLLFTAMVFLVAAIYFICPPLNEMLLSMNTENGILRGITYLSKAVPLPLACLLLIFVMMMLIRILMKKELVFKAVLGKKKNRFLEMRFIEEFKHLIEGGMDVVSTLELLVNEGYEERRIRAYVLEGMMLSEAFKTAGFSKMLLSYLRVAEETGDYVSALKSYLAFEKQFFKALLKKKTAMIEPTAILLMGVVVFMVAFIVMIPMLDAYENL